MTAKPLEGSPLQDPEGRLETALIDEYLHSRGQTPASLAGLPADEARRLLKEASVYAASKLAEVESRAHFVHGLHREE